LEGEIKVKEFLRKDLTLKILSIVFAIFLWFAINPVKTNYYTVPLNVINEESLKTNGLVLNNKNYQKYVDVSVRERGDVLNAIKDSDFEVTLDLSKVKTAEDKVVTLDAPVYLGREKISSDNIELKTKTVKLDIGKIEENPFIVQVETYGNLPSGYEIISKTADPDTVQIEALDSVISSVGSVKVFVDVSGFSKSLQVRNRTCKVYNKNGEEMPELSKKLTVDVKIEIGKRVPVIPITNGALTDDYIEGTNTVTPEKVLLTGDHNILSGINEIKTEPISIENATKTYKTQVLMQIPDGIKLVSTTREVSVTVEIIKLEKRSFSIPKEDITIEGMKTDGTVDYEITGPVTIKLRGKIEDLNKVTVSNLLSSISVDGLEDGNHNVPLKVVLPANITQIDEVLVPVKITTKVTK
jgi:YbbR domain-containing protein